MFDRVEWGYIKYVSFGKKKIYIRVFVQLYGLIKSEEPRRSYGGGKNTSCRLVAGPRAHFGEISVVTIRFGSQGARRERRVYNVIIISYYHRRQSVFRYCFPLWNLHRRTGRPLFLHSLSVGTTHYVQSEHAFPRIR